MDEKIATLAALKTFYESGDDLIGVFGNLILLVISNNTLSISDIKNEFAKKIDLNVPIDILQTIVKRLRKENLLIYEELKDHNIRSIQLTDDGRKLENKVRGDFESAKREKNALVSSLKSYLERNGKKYSDESVANSLNNFLSQNCHEIIFGIYAEDSKRKYTTDAHSLITEFIAKSEKSDPDNYERLKTIIYGKVLSLALLKRNIDFNAKVKKLSVYLDTNIVFSLMGLHDDYYNNSVEEIVDLIRKSGCTVKIFSFTKDEISYKLGGYLKEYGFYSSEIKVDSIYYNLKRKGYSKSDVISIIENIEGKMNEMEIAIDYTFNLDELTKDKSSDLSDLNSIKVNSHPYSIKHDLSSIIAIKDLRGIKKSFIWEKSDAIFLSADAQLASYDYKKHGHEEDGTFPEVIYRSDLARMFWIKKQGGSDNVFMHNFLANFLREKIISENLWNKFIYEIKRRRDSGEVSQDTINEMISYSETEKILREKGESGIKEILDDYKLTKKRQDLVNNNKDRIKNEEIIEIQTERFKKIGLVIETDCKSRVGLIINILIWFIALLLLSAVGYAVCRFGISNIASIISLAPTFLIIVLAIVLTIKKEIPFFSMILDFRKNIENKFVSKCIINKKKKFDIR